MASRDDPLEHPRGRLLHFAGRDSRSPGAAALAPRKLPVGCHIWRLSGSSAPVRPRTGRVGKSPDDMSCDAMQPGARPAAGYGCMSSCFGCAVLAAASAHAAGQLRAAAIRSTSCGTNGNIGNLDGMRIIPSGQDRLTPRAKESPARTAGEPSVTALWLRSWPARLGRLHKRRKNKLNFATLAPEQACTDHMGGD